MTQIEEVVDAVFAYWKQHDKAPKRITVSQEVAAKLDAEAAARKEKGFIDVDAIGHKPQMVAEGDVMYISGVPVVADLAKEDAVDVR